MFYFLDLKKREDDIFDYEDIIRHLSDIAKERHDGEVKTTLCGMSNEIPCYTVEIITSDNDVISVTGLSGNRITPPQYYLKKCAHRYLTFRYQGKKFSSGISSVQPRELTPEEQISMIRFIAIEMQKRFRKSRI